MALFLCVIWVKYFTYVMKLMTSKKIGLFFVLLLVLSSCATPTSRLHNVAKSHNFSRSVVDTHGFTHLVYTRNLIRAQNNAKSVLHVYLEGDGSPWKYRVVTMPDPTPRDPLVLRLMAQDSAPSAYVGRPCYNGTSKDPGCDESLWTSGRYSTTVVNSMSSVIRGLMDEHGFGEVKLIGHSGGGALAMLIAAKIKRVSHVVTIAGNLDTNGWTRHHGYSRLYTSLNPAEQPNLPAHIKQWHLVGGRDQIVPPSIVKGFIRNQTNALGSQVQNFSHGCCWESIWGNIAKGIASSSSGFLPGTRFKLPTSAINPKLQ